MLNEVDCDLEQQDSIFLLVPDILEIIFSYLDVVSKCRAAQVCVAWRDVIYLRSVWRGVCAQLKFPQPYPDLYQSFDKRGIENVYVRKFDAVGIKDMLQGMPNLGNLSIIEYQQGQITDSMLTEAFVQEIPSLEKLSVECCFDVTEHGLRSVFQNCPNLVSLNLSCSHSLTDASLLIIAQCLGKLKELNLSYVDSITDVGVDYICGANPNVAIGNPLLETLHLAGCTELTDDAVANISSGLFKLRCIHLGGPNLTDRAMAQLSTMRFIGELRLSNCANITVVGLVYIANISSLQKLHLCKCNGIGDSAFAALAIYGSRITKLILECCDQFTDFGMLFLARLPCLVELYITKMSIGDFGVSLLTAGDSKVKRLALSSCFNLTNGGMDHISKMPCLQEFSLRFCNIDDAGLFFLVNHSRSIVHLELSFVDVSDVGLPCLIGMPHLRTLNLNFCPAVSINGLIALFQLGSKITRVDVDPSIKRDAVDAGVLPFLGTGRTIKPNRVFWTIQD